MTIQVHSFVIADGRTLRRLAANAVIFGLERRIERVTYHSIDPDGQNILALRVLLDRIGAEPTEPFIRARVQTVMGQPGPVVIGHLDVRLRDWLALPVADVGAGGYEQVGPLRRVQVDHLVPDEHTPPAQGWTA